MTVAHAQAEALGFDDIARAHERIRRDIRRTPVLTSSSVDARTGAQVFFKCENLQRTGAFKIRGALNALSQLRREDAAQGVVTYSSGNHGQAIALAGRQLGIRTTIVMPSNVAAVKLEATRAYGAQVVHYDPAGEPREAIAERLAVAQGATIIPPFDHPHVVAGQGTAAKELIEETGALDYLFAPCGGGGLLSGSAISAHHLSPGCRVIGVEPLAGDDATRSFRTRTLQRVHNPQTIADGARTASLGSLTFPLLLRHVDDMLTVNDPELLNCMFFLWERMKLLVEPTGALGAAAVLAGLAPVRGRRVGVIVSGGNVDLGWALSARNASDTTLIQES